LGRAAQTRSQLYILEDLQWADESTLALLIHLANRVAQIPVVIIGTYRDGYTDNNPALLRTLEELIRMGSRPLKLGGLSKDATAQMLRGLSQRLYPLSYADPSLVRVETLGFQVRCSDCGVKCIGAIRCSFSSRSKMLRRKALRKIPSKRQA
jgi:hypothetical protein